LSFFVRRKNSSVPRVSEGHDFLPEAGTEKGHMKMIVAKHMNIRSELWRVKISRYAIEHKIFCPEGR
jgi:hypothetical protein